MGPPGELSDRGERESFYRSRGAGRAPAGDGGSLNEAAAETPEERGGEEGEGEDDATLGGRSSGGALEDEERAEERALADAVAAKAEEGDGGEIGDGDGEGDFSEGGIESAGGGEERGGDELGEPDGEGDGEHVGVDDGRAGGATAGADEGKETRRAAEPHDGGAKQARPPAERQADRDQGGDEQADGRKGDGPDPRAHGGGFADGEGVAEEGDGGEHEQGAEAPEAVEEEAGEGIGSALGRVAEKMIEAGDLSPDAGG